MIFVKIPEWGWYRIDTIPANIKPPFLIVISGNRYLEIQTIRKLSEISDEFITKFIAKKFEQFQMPRTSHSAKSKNALLRELRAKDMHAFVAIPLPMYYPPMSRRNE